MINFSKKEEKPGLQLARPDLFREMERHIHKGFNLDLPVVTALCFVPYYAPRFGPIDGFNRRTINEIIIQSHESKFDSFVLYYSLLIDQKT